MRTAARPTRFEIFSHKRVMAKLRCAVSRGQFCIPMSRDMQCMACEEADYQASLVDRSAVDE